VPKRSYSNHPTSIAFINTRYIDSSHFSLRGKQLQNWHF